jgi:hypothetical protein
MNLSELKRICEEVKSVFDEYSPGKAKAMTDKEIQEIRKIVDRFNDTFNPIRVKALLELLEEAKDKIEDVFSLHAEESTNTTCCEMTDILGTWLEKYEKEMGDE